tara:strand:+ start:680 stop:2113 length:1434 start_codon:yes stop_codon:yes gene_type:complete
MNYPFKTKPYLHQLAALDRSWEKIEYAYFMEMGTGKSKVLIDNTAMLFDAGKLQGLVIIAPKGVYRNWSAKEIPIHLPEHIPSRIGVWSSRLTKEVKDELNNLFQPNDDLNILVMNIDAVITKKGKLLLDKFLNTRICLLAVDESTIIKSPSAKRTKAMIHFSRFAKYRRILTGSPVTKSPLDIFSQCDFLNPHLLGFSSYYSFRNRFAVLNDANYGGRTFKQVMGYKNTEQLHEILQEFSYRVVKEECLDLPPKVYMRREFEMTKEQSRVYKQMRQSAIAFLGDGEATTTTVLVQLLRLHQISCGFIPTDEGEVVQLENNRATELISALEEISGKVIIWANYRNDIFLLKDMLSKKYGANSFVTYFGDTKEDERVEAVEQFQDASSPVRFFLGNTQTGGYGITLTSAQTVIYYSNNYDLEKRLQSEDRAHRIGQENSVTYLDLVCKATVDEKIIKALRNKISLAQAVTGDKWREWI